MYFRTRCFKFQITIWKLSKIVILSGYLPLKSTWGSWWTRVKWVFNLQSLEGCFVSVQSGQWNSFPLHWHSFPLSQRRKDKARSLPLVLIEQWRGWNRRETMYHSLFRKGCSFLFNRTEIKSTSIYQSNGTHKVVMVAFTILLTYA